MAEIISNYVKFRRGTPEAFANLIHKDSDTLYFIYEEDELTGELYLGSKLIAGAGEINGATTLAGLTDILLDENLDTRDCLIYDISLKKWINKPIMSVIDNFVGANSTSSGIPGLVPAAPAAGQTGLFLRSDGQGAEVVSASSALVLQTILTTGEDHLDAVARALEEAKETPNAGDIVVLRDLIYGEDNYQHIAYVYDGKNWIAMDGNYDAENVYLANNLTITADIGVQKLNGAGSKVLETAGKNLKQVLDMLLAERTLPTRTNPSVSVTANDMKAYEVGTSIAPSYSASLNKGSYTYGPDTGVTATSWSATFNGQTLDAQSGTFNAVTVTDDFNQSITVKAVHTKGAAPKDNLGNVITDSSELSKTQIQSGEKSKTSSAITGFRYAFYGSKTTAMTLNSANIRGLAKSAVAAGTVQATIVEGASQVIIAVPTGFKVTKVADEGAFGTDIFSEFSKTTVSVAGASEGYDKDYNVYTYNPSAALGANTYTVTIAKG